MDYHSIYFLDKNFESEVFRTSRCCKYVGIIAIERPSDLINVELFPDIHGKDRATKVNVSRHLKWKGGSITTNRRIVVPISMTPTDKIKYRACSRCGGRGYNFRPSTVQLADFFPLHHISQPLPTRPR